ncbi:hypothetical protein ARMGADRAFT_1047942 [Armillaria gallica]|uniref:DDE-1 domain-containing protein n=1 Tax=Armillaria gallica TaxID=47427 RepID=A0A2H3DF51_ARMGA|nr:hypothetical protein ARMGADRAFT_1047942 [Armillaria gallica]
MFEPWHIITKSLLNDKSVQVAYWTWLNEQKVRTITSKLFQEVINTTILASLGIQTGKPLAEHTVWCGLICLGYQRTLIKKRVYMDGHERPDMVKYWDNVFLLAMALYEARMTHYEGPDLKPVEPQLPPGVKKIIAYFHDECCFHVLDYKKSAWLLKDQTLLQQKSCGHLIHVSDFLTEGTGRLIIYPGAGGDAWWDTQQLIKQVKHPMKIHDAVNLGTTALFIFDQLSAHASLSSDALHAFDMNKSNSGKQCVQKDTVIPQSNPSSRALMFPKCSPVCLFENTDCCMAWLLSKQEDFVKGRHECLFLPKFHCELNPIKMTFAKSKALVLQYLDACPLDTIWRFINQSWWFMTKWTMKQQKQHCAVSN